MHLVPRRQESVVRIAHHIDGRDVDFTEAFRAFVADVMGDPTLEEIHRWEDDGGRVSA